jgi:hypothetical protein
LDRLQNVVITGTKFGRYEIRSKIGEGGMGEVYLARDTKLDLKVVRRSDHPRFTALLKKAGFPQ